MKGIIYVSGPMRAPTLQGIQQNCMHLKEIGFNLIAKGWYAIVPAWFGHFLTEKDYKNIAYWEDLIIQSDCKVVERCDAIFMCKGWEHSNGAKTELETAKKVGLEIYYE